MINISELRKKLIDNSFYDPTDNPIDTDHSEKIQKQVHEFIEAHIDQIEEARKVAWVCSMILLEYFSHVDIVETEEEETTVIDAVVFAVVQIMTVDDFREIYNIR